MERKQVKAVVMAAGAGGEFADSMGVPAKALVPIDGVPMVRYVVEALAACQTVSETVLVTSPRAKLPDDATGGVKQVHAAGEKFSDTIAAAARIEGDGQIAIITADLPCLTPESVDATVNFALDSGADFTYTIADADMCESSYPGTKRTSIRLCEGRFTGGNIAVARRSTLLQCQELLNSLFGNRKNVPRLAMMLGAGVLIRIALGTLTLEQAAARASKILGGEVAVHASQHAEIAFDVDKPSDLEAAKVAFAMTDT